MKKPKKPESIEKKSLDLLLKNKSISKDDYKFLLTHEKNKTVSEFISSIPTKYELSDFTLRFDLRKISLKNITKELQQDINNLIIPNNFHKVNQNSLTNNINYTLNKFKRNSNICHIDLFANKGTVKTNKITYEIENFRTIKKFIRISTSKLLTFSIMKMNQNTGVSYFTVNDYAEFRNKSDRKTLANIIKGDIENGVYGDLDILKAISNIRHQSKEVKILDTIIYHASYDRRKITMEFNPSFAESLKQYYMFLPKELAMIDDRNYPHAWVLGYYIYEQSRINKKCDFELKVQSCLDRTTIPTYEDVKNTNRTFDIRIIQPFEKNMDILTENIKDLTIDITAYKTIEEFLKSKIKIKISNKNLICNYDEISNKRDRKNFDKNREKKKERIEKAIKLKNEGKVETEIAKIMNLTTKTIKSYLK